MRFYSFLLVLLMTMPSVALAKKIKPNEFRMNTKTVNGQFQVFGSFGSQWTAGEAKANAGNACAQAGKKLTSFKTGASNSRDGTSFFAVCE